MESTDLRLLFITTKRHLSSVGYSFWLQAGKTIKVRKKDTAAMNQLRGKVTIQLSRSSPSELFLGKGFLKICSKFTGEHPCRSAISVKLLCNFIKFAAYFQNTFSQEYLWLAAFGYHNNMVFYCPSKRQRSQNIYVSLLLTGINFSR